MWRKIGIGLAVVVLVIAGAAWYLFANLDHYVKAAIEKYGSAATQATVSVDSVQLSLTSGQGTISGLSVGNPQGFSAPHALTVGAITVQVDTSTVTGDGPIVIQSINVSQPRVTYQVLGGPGGLSLRSLNLHTRSNLSVLQSNVQAYAAGSGSASESSSPQRKEIIRDLYVTGGQVSVVASLLLGKTLTVPLPAIHLTNIGQSSGGVTAAQVGEQVLTAITSSAALAGAESLMKAVGSAATGPLGSAVGGKVKSLF
jgi:hypothetical protein